MSNDSKEETEEATEKNNPASEGEPDKEQPSEEVEPEEFFEKPVLIALGLFVLLIVGVMIQKAPNADESPQKHERIVKKEAKKKVVKPKTKDKPITPKKEVHEELPQKQGSIGKVSDDFQRLDRLGDMNFELAAAKSIAPCVYTVDATAYNFLNAESLSKIGLSGTPVISIMKSGNALEYSAKPIGEGCSNSYSFAGDSISFSPPQDGPASEYKVVNSDYLLSTSKGEMLYGFPLSRIRARIKPYKIPDAPQKLVIKGYYLGGEMKSKTILLIGKEKNEFTESEGRLSIELDLVKDNRKWTFIIASIRDFILIDYIGLHSEKGKLVLLGS